MLDSMSRGHDRPRYIVFPAVCNLREITIGTISKEIYLKVCTAMVTQEEPSVAMVHLLRNFQTISERRKVAETRCG